jgi:O-antigen/teichoic acid export membrane protein
LILTASPCTSNVVLNLLLIPKFGILGAAIASYAAMLAGSLYLYRLVQKRLGINACVVPLMKIPQREQHGNAIPPRKGLAYVADD